LPGRGPRRIAISATTSAARRSAPANLAEAFGRYRPRDAARFVRVAIASLQETMNHLGHARKQRYISQPELEALQTLAGRAKGASTRWLAYLENCPPDGPKRRKEPRTNPEPRTSEPNPEPRTSEPKSEPRTSEPDAEP
jgi:four helix bundle protein